MYFLSSFVLVDSATLSKVRKPLSGIALHRSHAPAARLSTAGAGTSVQSLLLQSLPLPSQSETLPMSSAPLPLDQTHQLLYWLKGTEQCHVLLCPGGGAALQMILGHLELSFSIVYSDPLSIFFYLFTTILFMTKCKP